MSAAKKIRVGIVGTGGIGYMHADGVRHAGDVFSLEAVCDTDADRLADFARHFEIPRTHTDFDALANDRGIDAILILAPHHLHEPLGLAAMRAGKHVLIEKPIARTLDEADRLLAEARRAGVVLMVGHNQRYFPAQRKAHDLLSSGALGRVIITQASHTQNFRPRSQWWRSKDAVGGGCVIASGIHLLDLMQWSLGPVAEVFAFGTHDADRLEGEVAASVSLKFRSGAVGNFMIHWGLTSDCGAETFEVYGKDGHLKRKAENALTLRVKGDDRELAVAKTEYPTMWQHFGECIRTGAAPLTSGRQGREALALVLAIHRSMDTGKPVALEA